MQKVLIVSLVMLNLALANEAKITPYVAQNVTDSNQVNNAPPPPHNHKIAKILMMKIYKK